jgi:hypothetical protein
VFRKRSDFEVVDDGAPVCSKCRRAARRREYPYSAGGFIVLGPDVVMMPDGSRIRFQGEWFHPVKSHARKGSSSREVFPEEQMLADELPVPLFE